MAALLVTIAILALSATVVALIEWWRRGSGIEKLEQAVWDTRPTRRVNAVSSLQQATAAHNAAVEACHRARRRRKFVRHVATVCAVIGLLPFAVIGACSAHLAGRGGAPAAARAWVDRNRPSWRVSECQPRDTNSDGYVTCTIVGPGDAIDAIECGVDRWFHGLGVSGCKPALRGVR